MSSLEEGTKPEHEIETITLHTSDACKVNSLTWHSTRTTTLYRPPPPRPTSRPTSATPAEQRSNERHPAVGHRRHHNTNLPSPQKIKDVRASPPHLAVQHIGPIGSPDDDRHALPGGVEGDGEDQAVRHPTSSADIQFHLARRPVYEVYAQGLGVRESAATKRRSRGRDQSIAYSSRSTSGRSRISGSRKQPKRGRGIETDGGRTRGKWT